MTYDELRRDIKTWTSCADSDFLGSIDGFIRQAENLIVTSVKLPNFSSVATVSLSSQLVTLTPADFLSVENIWIAGYGNLEQKDPSFIYEAYSSAESGPPRYFGMASDAQLILGPTPDQSYSATMRYFSKPKSICDSHSGTYISNRWEVALLQGSLMFAAVWMKDPDMFAQHEALAAQALGLAKGFAKGRSKKQDFEKGNAAIESGELL